ncbi:hypothetical protein A9B99_21090 [Mangrovibacter phragmitis]|uniref:DUF1330 domain-containing protein n=1 Tax=Mangrovibacter phragmitis TaxID=1691903 RepID=A0A1B7L5J3_9ENTR|nr:DUF1330 domain-containing protein [Mangrovibacter phragmitis]OAT77545.1 hypothetical protein A9B99_21090 [Mangrovibacter phragmitis]
MSAYVIFVRKTTHDEQEMQTYAKLAGEARGDHPITPLAFYGDITTLEGDDAEGAVILSFPDIEAAKAWYYSDAYQEAKKHRNLGADYQVLLIQGV